VCVVDPDVAVMPENVRYQKALFVIRQCVSRGLEWLIVCVGYAVFRGGMCSWN
jgi:hypothetical protein